MFGVDKVRGIVTETTPPLFSPHTVGNGVPQAWRALLADIDARLRQLAAHPARSVVLLPYEQLIPLARRQWMQQFPSAYVPRFETTRTWAGRLWSFKPGDTDISANRARNLAVAASMLAGAGQGAQRRLLTEPLADVAEQLAQLASSVPPQQRPAWMQMAREVLPQRGGVLGFESVLAHIAVAWAGSSDYEGDALFAPRASEGLDALVIVPGLRRDELLNSLAEHYFEQAERVELLPLLLAAPAQRPALHPCADAEDEASRAAACVLRHIEAGRTPVALASGDRELLRRCAALLATRGVRLGHELHDETGWRLSTTHAAAQVMALLAACAPGASSDEVLAFLKHVPAFTRAEVDALEALLRRRQVRQWAQAQHLSQPAAQQFEALRSCIPSERAPLHEWLRALQRALHESGLWAPLAADGAGGKLITALGLEEGGLAAWRALPAAGQGMQHAAFTAWVAQSLEAEDWRAPRSAHTLVEMLPLAQLFGRPFAALVLAGADSEHLPAAPAPDGMWTRQQREALHLPLREERHEEQKHAWALALRVPHVDVLWRRQGLREGEPCLPSPLLQAWALEQGIDLDDAAHHAPDPRPPASLPAAPQEPPAPSAPAGAGLPWAPLSASSYARLRACPYQFFALSLLRLAEVDELDAALDKSDWGTWLHTALLHFHRKLAANPQAERATLMNEAEQEATREQQLDEGEFLPYALAWPALRDAYLDWLQGHEQQGWRFVAGEQDEKTSGGGLPLKGRLDRLDQSGAAEFILDYKTGSRSALKKRTALDAEDVQLPFYALLRGLPAGTRAGYLSLSTSRSEGKPALFEYGGQPTGRGKDVKSRTPEELAALLHERAEQLLHGMTEDTQRIDAGAPLRPLGEGSVCNWCPARGLCRRDWWGAAPEGKEGDE